jgi:hypothetical protein
MFGSADLVEEIPTGSSKVGGVSWFFYIKKNQKSTNTCIAVHQDQRRHFAHGQDRELPDPRLEQGLLHLLQITFLFSKPAVSPRSL